MDHFQSFARMRNPEETKVDCSRDPISSIKEMFVEQVQAGRIETGQCPALRPVFLKPHGVAKGLFRVRKTFTRT